MWPNGDTYPCCLADSRMPIGSSHDNTIQELWNSDKMKALTMCLNRFDEDTKASFLDLYTKIDAGASAEEILTTQNDNQEVSANNLDND